MHQRDNKKYLTRWDIFYCSHWAHRTID